MKPFIFFACALLGLPFLVPHTWARTKSWNAPRLVVSNCSGCHAVDGNAPLSYIPKLAGLQANYMKKKLTAFREPVARSADQAFLLFRGASAHQDTSARQARLNMLGISLSASQPDFDAAVAWYEKQTPRPGHGGSSDRIERGRTVFVDGVPGQHIVACKACHGENALGNATAPRLASQNIEYLLEQIQKFRTGDRKHAPEMTQVVRELNDEQARAVAAYLNAQ